MTGGDGTTSNFPSTAALQHQSVDNDGGWGGLEEMFYCKRPRETRNQRNGQKAVAAVPRLGRQRTAQPAGGVNPHEEAGTQAHILLKKIRRTVAGGGHSTVVTSSAGSRLPPNKTLVTTIMISEEANPTGQRTRVMDMNMSLTF